jgi:hypothetical protein
MNLLLIQGANMEYLGRRQPAVTALEAMVARLA